MYPRLYVCIVHLTLLMLDNAGEATPHRGDVMATMKYKVVCLGFSAPRGAEMQMSPELGSVGSPDRDLISDILLESDSVTLFKSQSKEKAREMCRLYGSAGLRCEVRKARNSWRREWFEFETGPAFLAFFAIALLVLYYLVVTY